MANRLDIGPDLKYKYAVIVWQYLLGKAQNRQSITYDQLSRKLELAENQAIRPTLPRISKLCQGEELPLLTVLVVDASGKPGSQYPGDFKDLDAERERVFSYPWSKVFPPSPDDFRAIWDDTQD